MCAGRPLLLSYAISFAVGALGSSVGFYAGYHAGWTANDTERQQLALGAENYHLGLRQYQAQLGMLERLATIAAQISTKKEGQE